MVVKLAPASWSAPALWRFGNDADIPERLSQPRRWQCFDKCSDLTNDLTDGPNDGRKRQRGCWLRSVTRSKAAEGRTHSKTLRADDDPRPRASVLECASPLALWPNAHSVTGAGYFTFSTTSISMGMFVGTSSRPSWSSILLVSRQEFASLLHGISKS